LETASSGSPARSTRSPIPSASPIIALLLAAIGIYGLMAYAVEQRTQEIAIRLALGAQVRRMVVRQRMVLALVGVVIGLGAAFGLAQLIIAFLFGVTATDPLIFAPLGAARRVAARAPRQSSGSADRAALRVVNRFGPPQQHSGATIQISLTTQRTIRSRSQTRVAFAATWRIPSASATPRARSVCSFWSSASVWSMADSPGSSSSIRSSAAMISSHLWDCLSAARTMAVTRA
jgi:ABC-type antimicrobial peptide transport system permease subunit